VGIATDVFVKAGHVIVGCVDVNETSDTYSGIAAETASRWKDVRAQTVTEQGRMCAPNLLA